MVGAPVAFQTFDPRQQPSQFLLSGAVGTGVVVLLAVLRIYLGWAVRPGFSGACLTCAASAVTRGSSALHPYILMLLWGWAILASDNYCRG